MKYAAINFGEDVGDQLREAASSLLVPMRDRTPADYQGITPWTGIAWPLFDCQVMNFARHMREEMK